MSDFLELYRRSIETDIRLNDLITVLIEKGVLEKPKEEVEVKKNE